MNVALDLNLIYCQHVFLFGFWSMLLHNVAWSLQTISESTFPFAAGKPQQFISCFAEKGLSHQLRYCLPSCLIPLKLLVMMNGIISQSLIINWSFLVLNLVDRCVLYQLLFNIFLSFILFIMLLKNIQWYTIPIILKFYNLTIIFISISLLEEKVPSLWRKWGSLSSITGSDY